LPEHVIVLGGGYVGWKIAGITATVFTRRAIWRSQSLHFVF